jgi:hypothetical protein
MRVALFVVFVSVLTTPSEASNSCMSKTEARQHFGSVHIYWHGKDHCWDATPIRRHHTVRQNIHPPTAQRKIDQPKWHDAMSEMLPNEEPVRSPWVDRWIDIEPSPIVSRWVDIAPVAPPPITPIIKGEPEPLVTPRGMVMVIITIILTITIFELLFGGIRWAGPILARLQDARPGQDATADVDAHQV